MFICSTSIFLLIYLLYTGRETERRGEKEGRRSDEEIEKEVR